MRTVQRKHAITQWFNFGCGYRTSFQYETGDPRMPVNPRISTKRQSWIVRARTLHGASREAQLLKECVLAPQAGYICFQLFELLKLVVRR